MLKRQENPTNTKPKPIQEFIVIVESFSNLNRSPNVKASYLVSHSMVAQQTKE
jgi:hypothetical protein